MTTTAAPVWICWRVADPTERYPSDGFVFKSREAAEKYAAGRNRVVPQVSGPYELKVG